MFLNNHTGLYMEFKTAALEDFDVAFSYIERLWNYNTYVKEEVYDVYKKVISDQNAFAFFLIDNGSYAGFCHGCYFQTFWMSGLTCYVSSIITDDNVRGQGYGTALMDHARKLAESRGCRAMILDSGFPRTAAHEFYETYGFEKGCYGFEMIL